jgi:hypothetical protein
MFITPANAETGEESHEIPVMLTIVHSTKNIDVTLPATMPVSVLDGKVLTADNLRIYNNSSYLGIEISNVSVTDGVYQIASFSNFPSNEHNVIALCINGRETTKTGALSIDQTAFPIIEPQSSIPIRYTAKVTDSKDIENVNAANVVFTLKAVA